MGTKRRLRSVGLAELRMFAEACVLLVLAKAAVRLLPFRLTAGWMSRGTGRRGQGEDEDAQIDAVVLAVQRARRRFRGRTVCIHEGIAVHRMLRRRGIPSRFHYGISSPGDLLRAHVWVTAGDRLATAVGQPEGYHVVATFPPDG